MNLLPTYAAAFAALCLAACATGDSAETTDAKAAPLLDVTLDLPLLEDDPIINMPGSIRAGGAFSCDFGLPATIVLSSVGNIIERDRMYMAARPGFIRKAIPFSPAPLDGGFDSGGRYLFTTRASAAAYFSWVTNDFVLDGTHFFDRSIFLSPHCHVWSVIGATDFASFPDHHVFVRTERYATPGGDRRQELRAQYPAMQTDAQLRGYTGVWLLYSLADNLVEITYFTDRVLPSNPVAPDAVTLSTLSVAPPLGSGLVSLGYSETYDHAQFVLTNWLPFQAGDHGPLSPWPNSPPLPGPSCGDAICSPSRGEDGTSCAVDCTARCGDATCQPSDGESTSTCPSDCRLLAACIDNDEDAKVRRR